MAKLQIALQDNSYAEVYDFIHVKAVGTDLTLEFGIDDFDNLPLRDGATYAFIGKDMSVSLCGAVIKYLLLDKQG